MISCPKCAKVVEQQEITALYGFKKEHGAALLAEGNLLIAFCCGVAIMTERDEEKEESKLYVPPSSIILP